MTVHGFRADAGASSPRLKGKVDCGIFFVSLVAAYGTPRERATMKETGLQSVLDRFLLGYFSVFEPAPELETSVFRAKAGLVEEVASPVWEREDFCGAAFAPALRAALLESGAAGAVQDYGHFYPDFFQNFLIQCCRHLPGGAGRRFYALPRSREGDNLFLPLFSLEETWLKEAGEFFPTALEVLRSFLEQEAPREIAHLDSYQAQRLHAKAAEEYLARVIGHPNAFLCLNTIASLRYEKQDCVARIAFSGEGAIALKTSFDPPLSLLQYRKARKLLAALDNRLCLAASGEKLLGIARAEDINGPEVYLASLLKHLTWELSRQGRILLRSEEGRLSAGRRRMRDREIAAFVRRVLGLDEAGAGRVLHLIRGAAGAGHGGMLVFSEEAEQEAARLREDGIKVRPFMPDPEDLPAFSVMDGAILMDLESRCHALGVILDGLSCGRADSSRGARYNSALRYYEKNAGKRLLLVVLSDDGMFDLIPVPFSKNREPDNA